LQLKLGITIDKNGGCLQLKYRTYTAKVIFSATTGCFHGEVIDLKCNRNHRDTIVFLSTTKHSLQEALQQAVEQYLNDALSLPPI
jgi:predicted HicB family RNase H-like nuclease